MALEQIDRHNRCFSESKNHFLFPICSFLLDDMMMRYTDLDESVSESDLEKRSKIHLHESMTSQPSSNKKNAFAPCDVTGAKANSAMAQIGVGLAISPLRLRYPTPDSEDIETNEGR